MGPDYLGRPLKEEEKKHMDAHLTEQYGEGLLVGYRYYERKKVPVQFAFGHGLSYTRFSYSDCNVRMHEGVCEVRGNLENTGDCTGKEVIQIYAAKKGADENEPVKKLVGFEKIELLPGQKKAFSIMLDPRAFEQYDVEKKAWVKAEGVYELQVGSSSADIRWNDKRFLKRISQ